MGTGVLVIKLDDCIPFMNALSQLSNISNKADVKVSPFSFSVITTHPHLGFTATLNFSPQRFAVYAVDQYYSFSISLQFFHNAMSQFGQAQDLPSLCITALLLEPTKTIILNFTSPTRRREANGVATTWLTSLPSEEKELGAIDYGKYFTIHSEDLRRVINLLDVLVCVTVTNSEVRFHTTSQMVVVTKKGGGCEIVGYEEEIFGNQFKIILRPSTFFCRLSYNETERVSFYQTINNTHHVVLFPVFADSLSPQYAIYFPVM